MYKNITKTRWYKLCHRLGIEANQQEFQRLYTAYSEPHRAYHTLQHLQECIQHLDEYKQQHDDTTAMDDYVLVEIALWYHDAIYQPLAKHNERNSAEWATDFLSSSGVKTSICEQVYAFIMASSHGNDNGVDAGQITHQQQLLVDIDLAILGANRQRFEDYEQQIRAEYKDVPRFFYNQKRGALLQSFLVLPCIYKTEWFYTHFEQQARENLAISVRALQSFR